LTQSVTQRSSVVVAKVCGGRRYEACGCVDQLSSLIEVAFATVLGQATLNGSNGQ
jgi:hypothetical protein